MLDTASIFSISNVDSLRDISCNKYNGDPKASVRSNRRNFVLLLSGVWYCPCSNIAEFVIDFVIRQRGLFRFRK